jgi:hypothetical protein
MPTFRHNEEAKAEIERIALWRRQNGFGPRKIVQFSLDEGYVVALCDDGTLWKQSVGDYWRELNTEGIPL